MLGSKSMIHQVYGILFTIGVDPPDAASRHVAQLIP